MNIYSATRINRLAITTCVLLMVAVLLMLSVAGCGGDNPPSQDIATEFGAVGTSEVSSSSEPRDIGLAIASGVLGAIWLIICLFLGSWWTLLIAPGGVFIWYTLSRLEHYGLRYAAKTASAWSIITAVVSLMVVVLCRIF